MSSVPDSIPEMDSISSAQELIIAQFLSLIQEHYNAQPFVEVDARNSGSSEVAVPERDQRGGEPRVDLPPQWAAAMKTPEDARILAYKYLTARKWKIADALEMVTSTATWRQQHGVDQLALFPPAFRAFGYDDAQDILATLYGVEGAAMIGRDRTGVSNDFFSKACRLMDPVYRAGFHYWDKTGHPVLLMYFGRCDVRGLYKCFQKLCNVGEKPTHSAVRYHTFENEVAAALAQYRDRKNQALPDGHPDKVNRRILGVTCIIDCGGLGYSHLWNPILDVLRSEFAVDAAHYPEGLHRVLVVNCPTMIKFAYTIVKGALDPRVQQKIIFCSAGKETTAAMLTVMDAKYVPKCYGGSWECPSGGAPDWFSSDSEIIPPGDGDKDNSDAITEDISVSAGTSHIKEYRLEAKEEVSWEFTSTSGYDIKFHVHFFPETSVLAAPDSSAVEGAPASSGNLDAATVVVPVQKLKDGSDRYVATTGGVLRLVWDNSSSWFKGKKLQMRIIKSAPVDVSEA